jgi:HEAT repeat protein
VADLGDDDNAAAPAAAAVLAAAMRKSNPRDRAYIQSYLLHLRKTKEEVVLSVLVALLRDEDAGVRASALRGLQDFGDDAAGALPRVRELLKDGAGEVRLRAAEAAWCVAEDAGAVPVLAELLSDPDEKLRRGAAEFLGEMGPAARAALPALRAALADRAAAAVRVAAAEAVWRIDRDARAAVPALIAALRNRNDQFRDRAAAALGQIGPDAREAAPALAEVVEDETVDLGVRLTAAEAAWLVSSDVRTTVPVLIDALQSEDKEARTHAAGILERMGPAAADAVPALTEALNDPDEDVREASAQALRAVVTLPADPDVGGPPGDAPARYGTAVIWVAAPGAGLLLLLMTGWFLVRSRRPKPFGATSGADLR